MSKIDALHPIEQQTVSFYGDPILAAQTADNQIWVPIKPVCSFLGIDWSSQRQRIRRDEVLNDELQGVVITTPPSDDGRGGGEQIMLALPLEFIPGWLFGIQTNRIDPERKEQLIRYRRECYRILAQAFIIKQPTQLQSNQTTSSPAEQAYHLAMAVAQLAQEHINLEQKVDTLGDRLLSLEIRIAPQSYILEEEATQISQAIKAIALALGERSGKNEFGAVWGEFYRRFGVAKYRLLPRERFDEALNFLEAWYRRVVPDPGVLPF